MAEKHLQAVEAADQAHERGTGVLAELISVASADKVFSEPVIVGDNTVITAAEVQTGMGFGYGLTMADAASGERRTRKNGAGPSSGGGGGGQAGGRPVAVVTINPEGVSVQPVLDRTKIAVTALTAAGAIGLMLIRLRRTGGR